MLALAGGWLGVPRRLPIFDVKIVFLQSKFQFIPGRKLNPIIFLPKGECLLT